MAEVVDELNRAHLVAMPVAEHTEGGVEQFLEGVEANIHRIHPDPIETVASNQAAEAQPRVEAECLMCLVEEEEVKAKDLYLEEVEVVMSFLESGDFLFLHPVEGVALEVSMASLVEAAEVVLVEAAEQLAEAASMAALALNRLLSMTAEPLAAVAPVIETSSVGAQQLL